MNFFNVANNINYAIIKMRSDYMKKKVFLVLLMLTLLLVGCEKSEKETNFSNENFAINFLQMENNNKNIIYSPLSIKYALNMLNEGASGNTKIEIENVIKDLSLTKYDNYEKNLSLANAIYIRDTYSSKVNTSYVDTLSAKYNAEVHNDPFNNANNINNFIKNKTLGLIERLIDDMTVQAESTKMIIINALAIDMEWKNGFSTTSTYGSDFTKANGEKIEVTMMHQEANNDNISYYKKDGIQALKMDLKKYGNNELEFIAIMPEDLNSYIKSLKYEDINNIKKNLIPASKTIGGLKVEIPKFKFDYSLNLKKDLMDLGINDVFSSEKADLSNMTNANLGLYISDALHKATIDFSEDGIKAAAVTAFIASDSAFVEEQEPEVITFDKPFMYIIDDKNTSEVWFVGSVYEPNLWANDKAEYMQ